MATTGRDSGPDPRDLSPGRLGRIGQSIGRCLTNSSCWAVSVLVLCLLSAAFLVQNILLDLERHRSAIEDRVLWNIAQAELELSALELAITHSLIDNNPGSLAQVRRAYDIFYSRVSTFEEGTTYDDLRHEPSFAGGMARVRDYLDRTTAVIDAPDATLSAVLGQLHVETDAIRDPVRQMALETVRNRTVYADAIRDTLLRTLLQLGGIAALLILALLLSTIFVLRLSRSAEDRARRIGETKTRIEAILTRTNRAVITVDGNGTVTDFNRAAEQMFGIEAADVLDRHLEDVPIDDAMKDAIYRLMAPDSDPASGLAERLVGRLTHARRRDGKLFPVEVSMSAIDGPTGRGVLVWIADIGARLQRERELNEALESAVAGETAKARMLNLMSHEIRTPLNGLVGALQVLGDTTLTPRQEKIVGAMQTSCDILMSHVNSVLGISQIDAGRLDCAQDPFDLEEVARQVHDNQIHAARIARNHLIVENAIAGGATYLGDAKKIRQVLINLVSNATKFTQDGEIRLRLSEAPSGEVMIEVSDTGIGIAPEHHERIFQDFVTIDASYERNAGGTGLGLPLCRRLARMMGGSLTVQSAIGAGSTFCLTLPLAPAPSAVAAAAAPLPVTTGDGDGPAPSGKSLRILVAEDNLINLEILTDMLTGDGHSVTSARDGEAAVRLAGAEAFDIILMDISMPLLNGADATRAIRRGDGPCRDVPIIAVTAYAQRSEIDKFLGAGMSAAIVKPVSRTRLREILGTLGGAGATQGDDGGAAVDMDTLNDLVATLGQRRVAAILGQVDAEVQALAGALDGIGAGGGARDAAAQQAHRLAGAVALIGARGLRDRLASLESALTGGAAAGQIATQSGQVEADWARIRALAEGAVAGDGTAGQAPAAP